ncbi:hypothetical protein QN277_015803 [Acacia crassicarpa]|uniref:glucan endo-1,3-beta-D-glucosidase n=1 Tax=Acacia crassicarpa TaxID=499986 RepID=A0AAE1JZ93_9FABA|nr:hypothetical protein QN277_015803 [Acacia crassicarpa]
MFRCSTFSLFLLSLLPAISSLPCIGVTHHSHPPSSHRIPTALHSLNINSLLLRDSDPHIIQAFLYTNVSIVLTIPNTLVSSIGTNRSHALQWLYRHVVPFYPRVNITTISVGNDFTVASPKFVDLLFPAIRNVHLSLREIGIRNVTVSTSFSFTGVITKSFPPSTARFQDFPGVDLIGPILQFLRHTNSSFLINLYPYNMYRLNSAIPIGFALFLEYPFNFRDDVAAGVRYQNLFDMMIDAVVSAMAAAGYENIPIVVTETGWPSAADAVAGNEEDVNKVYAEIYLKGLVKHLKSGKGTPLRKEGVAGVYIYELFDEEKKGTQESGQHWGILYPNLTNRYSFQFSGSWSAGAGEAKACMKILLEVSFLFLLLLSY